MGRRDSIITDGPTYGSAGDSNDTTDRDAEEAQIDENAGVSSESSGEGTRTQSRRVSVLLRSPQGPRQRETNDGATKRYKSTGEKTTEAILELAIAHKTLADASIVRQTRPSKLSRSDVAIKLFEDELGATIGVASRFRFIQLVANSDNAATTYCGMDEECRGYFVQEFLSDNTDSS